MQPKLIFSDIDGTLLNSDRDLSQRTIAEVKRLQGKVPFLLVSARMPKQMTHLQKQLGNENSPLICYNGALVLDGNEVLHSVEIDNTFTEKLIEHNEQANEKIHISLFHNNQWFVENEDHWAKREENNTKTRPEIQPFRTILQQWKNENIGAHKIMCMGEVDAIERTFDYLKTHFSDDLHLYRSKDTYIEITNKKVSKLTGIEKLIATKYPKVTLADIMTFGDNYNDVSMTASVGFGIAVANARDEVKAVAKAVTDHHKNDGVAKFIAKMTF